MTSKPSTKIKMPKVDMSAAAVTTRLKRLSQLRRLGLSLQKAKLPQEESRVKPSEWRSESSRPQTGKNK
jgi:hypothetical protein